MPARRYSSSNLAAYVSYRLHHLEAEFGFDRAKDHSQVEGQGEELNRVYGEYDHLRELLREFDLHVHPQSPRPDLRAFLPPVTRALLVLVLDPKTRAYLRANDPKALEQARAAILRDPALPADKRGLLGSLKV